MTMRIGEGMREEEKGAIWHKWEELLVWVADERLMVVLVESLAAGVAPMQEEEVAVKEREVHDGITVHHDGMSWRRRLG